MSDLHDETLKLAEKIDEIYRSKLSERERLYQVQVLLIDIVDFDRLGVSRHD